MKICYLVYREDNVMVFNSQVLEYLKNLNYNHEIANIELIIFRHEQNLFKGEELKQKIQRYVPSCKTFPSLPVLSMLQLELSVRRLKKYIKGIYGKNEQIAVICRGDLAAYVGTRAFLEFPNSRVLYDNRGIAYEESELAHGNKLIHRINRDIKRNALNYAKDHCDMYNFVTNPMRDYFINKYSYNKDLPFTIIPTLYKAEIVDEEGLNAIKEHEKWSTDDFIVTYVGSTAAWQSIEVLVELINKISQRYINTKFFILTNGVIPEIKHLPLELKEKITVKSVPHSKMKYYLAITNIGVVIRDDNIVNRVSAPTKIAEYLTSGLKILFSGNIGIISDIRGLSGDKQLIELDSDEKWLSHIGNKESAGCATTVSAYFDMTTRQKDTIEMINNSFSNAKIK